MEFFIVLVEEGKLTPQLWKLQPGDKLDVSERAAGGFTLSHCPDASVLWLIATGTGIAPYIAMLRTASPGNVTNEWYSFMECGKHAILHTKQNSPSMPHATESISLRLVVSREDKPGALQGRITTCLANGSLENVVDQH